MAERGRGGRMIKIGHSTLHEGHQRTLEDQLYAEAMAERLRETAPKRRGPTHFNGKPIEELNPEERREFIISQQPPSTRACLLRDPKDDAEWHKRGFGDWKAVKNAKTLDEAVAKRALDPSEVVVYEGLRRQVKNELGDSKDSSVTQEARERAIHAFTYSRPATLTPEERARLQKLEPIKAVQPDVAPAEKPLERKPSLWERLLGFVQGKPSGAPAPGKRFKQRVTFQGKRMVIQTYEVDDANGN